MEIYHQKTERTYLRMILGTLGGITLLIVLGWGGYRYYAKFEADRLARRGSAFLSGGDSRQASLAAHSGLQLDEDSLPNLRLLSEITEAAGDKMALVWRRRAAETNPNSREDAIALCKCALQFDDLATAEKILRSLARPQDQTADFYAMAAQVAETRKEIKKSEEYWAQAVRLAPAELSYQLQFAMALLRADEPSKRSIGIAMLQKLRSDEKQKLPATRALLVDGLSRHRDPETLAEWAKELQNYPGVRLSDRILYANILRRFSPDAFAKYLSELENTARANPADAAHLISWMSANGLSLIALEYARSLPDEVVAKVPVAPAVVAACVKVADWPRLKKQAEGDWGQYNFLRRAYIARAFRDEGDAAAARKEWEEAEKEATPSTDALNQLIRITREWEWREETTDLLWILSKHTEAQKDALHQLNDIYAKERDTTDWRRVLVRLVELEPEDDTIVNDFAQVSLLLGVDLDRARALIAALYQKKKSNPTFASTYAFSLYTAGNTKGAVAVMRSLSEEQLRDPSLAAYYGIILAAAGDNAAAWSYLRLGASTNLLPEEERLVATAQKAVQ